MRLGNVQTRHRQRCSHHVNGFIDDNILDLAHLNEGGSLPTWGVAGGHLNAQGADNKQRLVVYLHKVDVEHHANQGDEYGRGENSCVLQEREEFRVTCLCEQLNLTQNSSDDFEFPDYKNRFTSQNKKNNHKTTFVLVNIEQHTDV